MLRNIPDAWFEAVGSVMGLMTLAGMGVQVFAEYTAEGPSTMSVIYVTLLIINFSFWGMYGLKFKRAALGFINGGAVVLQVLLLAVILFK